MSLERGGEANFLDGFIREILPLDPMLRTPVTHVFTHFRLLGGVESVLRRLARRDASLAPERRTLSLFEAGAFTPDTVSGLGLTRLDTPAGARDRLLAAVRRTPRGGLWVYHNGWGLPFLAGADDAERRLVVLHSDWPGLDHWLAQQRGRLDGLLAVSQPLLRLAATQLELPPERLGWLPYPIDPPADTFVLTPTPPGRPLVLGFCGRVIREQKRLDRLPGLAQRVTAAGVEARWEILGDGPYRPALAAGLPTNTVFHGRLSGLAYWRALERWDLMVFTSDYEGLPISLLETFARGGLAVFPRIGSGGDDYVEQVAPELLYRAGELDDACRAIRWFAAQTPATILKLRRRAQALGAAHAGDAFDRTLNQHLEALWNRPRISQTGAAAGQLRWNWRLPFAVLRRLPVQSRLRRDLF